MSRRTLEEKSQSNKKTLKNAPRKTKIKKPLERRKVEMLAG